MKNVRVTELLNLSKESYGKSEYKKAMVYLEDIIDMAPQDKDTLAQTYYLIGNIFHIKGEIGKAIKAFNKVLELDPSHTDASISLSVLYNDIGHYESAKKVFNQANERVKAKPMADSQLEDKHINKKFSDKHYELAEMYSTYNRYDEALFEYNKASVLSPENLEIRIKVAKIYAKKNFINKAIDELMQLKNEHPTYLEARVALGILYYGNGKILEAQSEWERVLSKEPHNQEAGMYLNLSKTATETTL
tara:strand:- start:25396 stop:26139 length:744 start_codon:yes stop_codon:yes gene_type:complete